MSDKECHRQYHRRPRDVIGGAALAAAAVLVAPAVSEARPWKTKSVQATICADGKPFWGRPANAKFLQKAKCEIFATTLSGEVKYNGEHAYGRWINAQRWSAPTVKNNVTWKGYWNDGAKAPDRYMDLGVDGEVSVAKTQNTYWLRIDVRPDGKATLRGGNYTG